MKKLVFIVYGTFLTVCGIYSQNISLTGVVNYYLKVDEVLTDRVRVVNSPELDSFKSGDIALLIQMTGASMGFYSDTTEGYFSSINNAGKYEILQIEDIIINAGRKYVVFTHALLNTYSDNEKIQLVRFAAGETVTITGTINAKPWNDSVGGIVAIIGTDSVKMNIGTTINVNGSGFKGAQPENYTGGCWNETADTSYFLENQLNRSGRKGEGITSVSWPYTKGWGYNLNGGGSGNRQYAGGAGGSNFGQGGIGGKPSCGLNQKSQGGWPAINYYKTRKLVFMGGGGGSGVYNTSAGKTASMGGNGAGIIFLITGTFKFNNTNSLLANGDNVSANATGSGAGGGGGGAILIDVTNYVGNSINVYIKGGKGGNTTSNSPCTGSGAGGGGGILWHSLTTIPASIAIDSSSGSPGNVGAVCPSYSGSNGNPGGKLKNLILPLTGFLFNTLHGTDTICGGEQPNLLSGSQPKGGTGTYIFDWEKSTDILNWISASGTGKDFQPPALSQTTYFRRIVSSGSINDTSKTIKILVYPVIGSNSIFGTDTICSGNHGQLITGLSANGGDGPPYQYQWQYSDNQTTWYPAKTASLKNDSIDPGILIANRYYRRIVTAYCTGTSNVVIITALPVILNNEFISLDSAICKNQSPGLLNAKYPQGGDNTYLYEWEKKSTSGEWQSITGATGWRYNPGILIDTTKYRRLVFSGNGKACRDTIPNNKIKTINVLSSITNNSINGAPIQYACYNSTKGLPGSQPANGDGTYGYLWEQSSNNIDWEPASGTQKNFTTPQSLTYKTYFRRTVYSSQVYHQCTSVSNPVEVRINQLPTGDVSGQNDTVCNGGTVYVKFNITGSTPLTATVGDGVTNRSKETNNSIDSIEFTLTSGKEFRMISIMDDSTCYAVVDSFINKINAFVYNYPVAYAGDDAEICSDTYTLAAQININGSTGLWTSTDESVFENPENPNSIVTVNNYGSHSFTWTETNWQCPDADEVNITFYEQPQATDAGPDQQLDFSFTTQLEAATPIVGTGSWLVVKGAGEFNDPELPNATVSELADDNLLRWTVINGTCASVKDSMEIIVSPLVVPKGFTPNGDTKNDKFVINAPNAEKIGIKIYNSLGGLVYESDDYLQGDLWNGKGKNGIDLPEGTYFYVMDVKVAGKEKVLQYKSFVEILR